MSIEETIEKAAQRINDEARKFSPEIADWIDAQRAAGTTENAIYETLRAATSMVRAGRSLKV